MILSLKNPAEQGLSTPHSFTAGFFGGTDPIAIMRSLLRLPGTYFGVDAESERLRLQTNCHRTEAIVVVHFGPAGSGS